MPSNLGESGRQRDHGQGHAPGEGVLSDLDAVGGSVISLKDVHWKKALDPILVKLGCSVIARKDMQPGKSPLTAMCAVFYTVLDHGDGDRQRHLRQDS